MAARRGGARSRIKSGMTARPFMGARSVVDPLFLEAGVALALAGHLDPACKEARGREQQAVLEMRAVEPVFLEGRDGDLLVVRVVLVAAGTERDRLHISAAIGARLQIGVRD